MAQTFDNEETNHSHPMVISGSQEWRDYTLEVRFAPESDRDQSGVVFRYRNDRCYYFFGLEKARAVLKKVQHATGFHKPAETILAEGKMEWSPDSYYTAIIRVEGDRIRVGNSLIVVQRS